MLLENLTSIVWNQLEEKCHLLLLNNMLLRFLYATKILEYCKDLLKSDAPGLL